MTNATYSSSGCKTAFADHYNTDKRGRWNGINIAVMVVSFVLFWPFGLVVLYWILKGRDVRDLPATARSQWHTLRSGGFRRSDNVVFDEYQQTQYDRIKEIQHEIDCRAKRFVQFRKDVQRRKDQEEFNRFMADAPDTRT